MKWKRATTITVLVGAGIFAMRYYMKQPNTVNQSAFLPTTVTVVPPRPDSLCAVSDTLMVRERGLDPSAVAFARANGYFNWCVPEFDDDQRFYDGQGGTDYGSIAHVLAAPTLDTLKSTDQFDGLYIQVAIIAVEVPVTSDLAPYHDLGLGAQNCVYLQHHSKLLGAFEWFTAVIVPPGTDLRCPAKPQETASQTLQVKVEPPSSLTPSGESGPAVPPTTRFIEGTNGRTLIGVKCASGWCVVGPTGFGDVPASAHDAVPALKQAAQGKVKGWFDDQVLGVPGSGKFGIHRTIRASAIPDPGLGSLHVQDFIVPIGTESYKIVGRTYFPEEPPKDSKYATVFGFGKDSNIVALRAEIHFASAAKQDTVWFAQVTDSHGNVKKDIPTRRTDHRKYLVDALGNFYSYLTSIPATMRWRWDDADEDLWAECDWGCCLVGKT